MFRDLVLPAKREQQCPAAVSLSGVEVDCGWRKASELLTIETIAADYWNEAV